MFKRNSAKLGGIAAAVTICGAIVGAGVKVVFFSQKIETTYKNSILGRDASRGVESIKRDLSDYSQNQKEMLESLERITKNSGENSAQIKAIRSYLLFCLSDNNLQQRCEELLRD